MSAVLVTLAAITFDVPDSWLDRTRMLESGGNDAAIGKAGERGAYQITRKTWEHYSRVSWRRGAHDPRESRRVARLILRDCAKACRRRGIAVTFANCRRIYRRGGF